MQLISKPWLWCGILAAALSLVAIEASALDKPKTMEDMWRIIEAQQQQLDEMKKKLEASAEKTSDNKPVQQLTRKTEVLSQEVEKLRTNLVIPEETKYKSMYGLGPAASKVYQIGKGLSIGGYGEARYQHYTADKKSKVNNADMVRMVLYTGYKFSDQILFNSELEFEHATTGAEGSVSVEFAAIDFFMNRYVNARAGMLLMPMGFINLIHEPLFYFGNNRPMVERVIIPATWREMGAGLFGQVTDDVSYTTYAVNGLEAEGFSSDGIRGARQSGSEAKAEDFAWVGRLDYTPKQLNGLSLGGSAYVGQSGQNLTLAGQSINALTQLYEGHIQWKYRGLEFRALGSWGHINDAALLSQGLGNGVIGQDNYGWYTELGYDVLPLIFPDSNHYLAPFYRYERYDTLAGIPSGFLDDPSKDRWIHQFGVQYKPIANVVIKADYRDFHSNGGSVPDDFNLGVGFIF